MSREHKKPAPLVSSMSDSPNRKYVVATCPACGEYPGDEGWQVCQYCDRWIEAYSCWWKKEKGFWGWLTSTG